ncbi:hypothetical protein LCGC14_2134430, partial [marine sediment metagenome]
MGWDALCRVPSAGALMALTLNQFTGFETGGNEEAESISGSPDPTEATVVRSGSRALKIDRATNDFWEIKLFDIVSSASNDHILGFGFRSNDVGQAGVGNLICRVRSAGDSRILELEVFPDGKLNLVNAAGSDIGTGTVTLLDDTWHYIEVRFTNLDPGDAEVFVD